MNRATLSSIGTGTCCCHSDPPCIPMTGFIISGNSSVLVQGLPTGVVSSIIIGTCGHVGVVVSGSNLAITGGVPIARISSTFVGCFTGLIVTGAANVLVGG